MSAVLQEPQAPATFLSSLIATHRGFAITDTKPCWVIVPGMCCTEAVSFLESLYLQRTQRPGFSSRSILERHLQDEKVKSTQSPG